MRLAGCRPRTCGSRWRRFRAPSPSAAAMGSRPRRWRSGSRPTLLIGVRATETGPLLGPGEVVKLLIDEGRWFFELRGCGSVGTPRPPTAPAARLGCWPGWSCSPRRWSPGITGGCARWPTMAPDDPCVRLLDRSMTMRVATLRLAACRIYAAAVPLRGANHPGAPRSRHTDGPAHPRRTWSCYSMPSRRPGGCLCPGARDHPQRTAADAQAMSGEPRPGTSCAPGGIWNTLTHWRLFLGGGACGATTRC